MKKLVLAAALAAGATAGYAGNLQEPQQPVVSAPVIVEETRGTSAGIVLPLVLLALVAVAVAAD